MVSFAADPFSYRGAEAAVKATVERFGRIDVLVDNAGTFEASFGKYILPNRKARICSPATRQGHRERDLRPVALFYLRRLFSPPQGGSADAARLRYHDDRGDPAVPTGDPTTSFSCASAHGDAPHQRPQGESRAYGDDANAQALQDAVGMDTGYARTALSAMYYQSMPHWLNLTAHSYHQGAATTTGMSLWTWWTARREGSPLFSFYKRRSASLEPSRSGAVG